MKKIEGPKNVKIKMLGMCNPTKKVAQSATTIIREVIGPAFHFLNLSLENGQHSGIEHPWGV